MAGAEQKLELPEMPDEVWDGHEHTSIHAAILFADLQNSVMISSTLSPIAYDQLISDIQASMNEVVTELKQRGLPIAEFSVAGDQLFMFFYEPGEVNFNYYLDSGSGPQGSQREKLIAKRNQANLRLAYDAFKAAIILKNRWLTMAVNTRRIKDHQEPFGLCVGIHSGRVFLRRRFDGQLRIEGYPVSLAKRVESASRAGKFSHIMFSQDARDSLSQIVISHTQLRQRIFFEQHDVQLELLKGISEAQTLFELKFFHRIESGNTEEIISHYNTVFALNKANRWAYFQLFDWYYYKEKDVEKAFALANQAFLVYPDDERILLDLARCHQSRGDLTQARMYCEQALELNNKFDIIYEMLWQIVGQQGDEKAELRYAAEALRLCPGSPINQANYALALVKVPDYAMSLMHIRQAIKGFPGFLEYPDIIKLLRTLQANLTLPDDLAAALTNKD